MASDPQGTVGRCWIERGVERLKLIVFTTYFTLLYFLSSVWIPAPGLRCACPTFNCGPPNLPIDSDASLKTFHFYSFGSKTRISALMGYDGLLTRYLIDG